MHLQVLRLHSLKQLFYCNSINGPAYILICKKMQVPYIRTKVHWTFLIVQTCQFFLTMQQIYTSGLIRCRCYIHEFQVCLVSESVLEIFMRALFSFTCASNAISHFAYTRTMHVQNKWDKTNEHKTVSRQVWPPCMPIKKTENQTKLYYIGIM
jgi:hypothetical protein